jgi:hypothetical protein
MDESYNAKRDYMITYIERVFGLIAYIKRALDHARGRDV